MSGFNVYAIIARFGDWYGELPEEERVADWGLMDDGESMSHYIVREDVPDLLAQLRASEEVISKIRAWKIARQTGGGGSYAQLNSILSNYDADKGAL